MSVTRAYPRHNKSFISDGIYSGILARPLDTGDDEQ